MIVLAEYPDAVWAQVVSYKFYIIDAVLVSNNIAIKVHSPGTSMSGSFLPGTRILVQAYANVKNERKSGYYILAIDTKDGVMGANPALSNFLFERYLRSPSSWFHFIRCDSEVTYNDSRFDFQLTLQDQSKRYVEVKSCFFTYENRCVFPLKHLRDLPRLAKMPPKYKPMSNRAIKHTKQLITCKGTLVFLAHCTWFQRFEINPREQVLKQLYDQLPDKYLLKVQWRSDKKVVFHSISKL